MGCAQTLKKQIGEGSLGRVHLGRWQETDVAIKVIHHVQSCPWVIVPRQPCLMSVIMSEVHTHRKI